jgi:hypothetical protein
LVLVESPETLVDGPNLVPSIGPVLDPELAHLRVVVVSVLLMVIQELVAHLPVVLAIVGLKVAVEAVPVEILVLLEETVVRG